MNGSNYVIGSKKLGECKICKEEIILLRTSDGERIYANHIKGCPEEKKCTD